MKERRLLAVVPIVMAACNTDPATSPSAIESRSSLKSGLSNSAIRVSPGEWVGGASLSLSASPVASTVFPVFTASPFSPDFIITGSEAPGFEHFVPSNGDGSFGARSDIAGLGTVDGMDVADLDRDGDNDFLVCDGGTGEVVYYRGDGTGTFTPGVVATGITSSYCTNLRIADFNNDNLPDFVVGDNRVTNGMHVYLQQTGGTFTKVVPGLDISTWSTIEGNSLLGLAAGDVDGDGNADVVVLGYNGIGAGQVRFYKGDGSGAMAASVQLFNVGTDFGLVETVGIGLLDLEGDGDLDLVIGGGLDGAHFVYRNSGAGTFTKPATSAFDVNTQTGIDAFDVDHDGDHDLVVTTWAGFSLLWLRNDNGVLSSPILISILGAPSTGVGAPELISSSDGGIGKAMARIEALVQSGVLNRGQGNALTTKLQRALRAIEAGAFKVAGNVLNAFVNQVIDLVDDGVLGHADGELLIHLARSAIALLGN